MLWILLCIQHGWSFADEPTIQLPQPADITEQDAKGPAEVVVGGPLPAGWRVQFWTMRGCGPCVVQKGVMQRGGLDAVTEVFALETSRDEARRLGVNRFPTLMLVDPDRKVRHRWVGGVSTATIISRAKQLAEAKQQPQASYQRRSSRRWNVSGDWSPSRSEAISHLQQQHPRALSTVPPDQLRLLSLSDLLALHDDAHNGVIQ